jgi:hypothetical protein
MALHKVQPEPQNEKETASYGSLPLTRYEVIGPALILGLTIDRSAAPSVDDTAEIILFSK